MERTVEEELRILRRVVAHKQSKGHKQPVVHVESRLRGPMVDHVVTVILYEIPSPEGVQAKDVVEVANLALRHAQEHAVKLGYTQVLGVRYNGKAWEARFQV